MNPAAPGIAAKNTCVFDVRTGTAMPQLPQGRVVVDLTDLSAAAGPFGP